MKKGVKWMEMLAVCINAATIGDNWTEPKVIAGKPKLYPSEKTAKI